MSAYSCIPNRTTNAPVNVNKMVVTAGMMTRGGRDVAVGSLGCAIATSLGARAQASR